MVMMKNAKTGEASIYVGPANLKRLPKAQRTALCAQITTAAALIREPQFRRRIARVMGRVTKLVREGKLSAPLVRVAKAVESGDPKKMQRATITFSRLLGL